MCPLIHQSGLYAFIVPGPKQNDLHRDGRYWLHSFPCEDNEDAFYCTCRAHAVEDPATRQALAELFVTERSSSGIPVPAADDHLFSFDVQRCLLTRTTGLPEGGPGRGRRRGRRSPAAPRHGVAASDVDVQPWGSFVTFSDPDGNTWALQQLPAWR